MGIVFDRRRVTANDVLIDRAFVAAFVNRSGSRRIYSGVSDNKVAVVGDVKGQIITVDLRSVNKLQLVCFLVEVVYIECSFGRRGEQGVFLHADGRFSRQSSVIREGENSGLRRFLYKILDRIFLGTVKVIQLARLDLQIDLVGGAFDVISVEGPGYSTVSKLDGFIFAFNGIENFGFQLGFLTGVGNLNGGSFFLAFNLCRRSSLSTLPMFSAGGSLGSTPGEGVVVVTVSPRFVPVPVPSAADA